MKEDNRVIAEQNKMIAEFMGGVALFNNDGTLWEEAIYLNGQIWLTTKPTDISLMPFLNYENDWNDTMPVVEKIEAIKNGIYLAYTVNIEQTYCTISHTSNEHNEPIAQFDCNTKLQATYHAIIAFLKFKEDGKVRDI